MAEASPAQSVDTGAFRPVRRDAVLVIIPALDEDKSIASVIARLRALGFLNIRVVDNGSRDGTASVARDAGADVILEPIRGYGMACWRGLQSLPPATQWLLFCDADGCDDLEALPQLIGAIDAGADFVIANRLALADARAALTMPQRLGNRLATVLIRLIWGTQFGDLGPMRIVRRDLLDAIDMQDRGFGWTVEMQIRVAEMGVSFAEIATLYRPRVHGRSKISGTVRGVIGAGTIILSTIARHALRRRRGPWPQ
jgi:glycosyltransferase involved in cell wall biosynthesis